MKTPGSAWDNRVVAEINVTPMIDVMLVLLIIFMVITPSMVVPAKLPQARKAVPEPDDRVTLVIDRAGRVFLNESRTPLSDAALPGALKEAYRPFPKDHVLYLKADEAVGYGRVLQAIDAARAAGVTRVTALTSAPARGRAERR